LPPSVGNGYFFLRGFLELKLVGDVFGNTQKQGSRIRHGFDLHGPERGQTGIIEEDFRRGKAHAPNMPHQLLFKKHHFSNSFL
jgi:hypothetical protein